ncbi:MAG: hypothetical protein Ct9H300mP28_30640 [Pseudomonadota bacterium]|nr:MAG: hypothetical protein Ct9H300mP28_30640 [Pseudomonadota bacterium]
MRYIPAYTRQEGGRTFAELVRGEDRFREIRHSNTTHLEMGEEEWAFSRNPLSAKKILLDGRQQAK